MSSAKLYVPGRPLPYLRLTQSSTQSISNNTLTTLSFDTVSGAGNGWTAPGTPVTTVTIPFSGLYLVVLRDLDWGDAAVTISTGVRRVGHELSAGATTRRMAATQVGAGGSTNNQSVQSFADVLYLPASETIKFPCLQTSGVSLNAGVDHVFIQAIQLATLSFS